jgi:hypothetical protein
MDSFMGLMAIEDAMLAFVQHQLKCRLRVRLLRLELCALRSAAVIPLTRSLTFSLPPIETKLALSMSMA